MNDPPCRIHPAQCERVAEWMRNWAVPPDREERPLVGFDRREIGNFYALAVAVCHQTSPIGRPKLAGEVDGRRLEGWDFLTARLEQLAHADRGLLNPDVWRFVKAERLRRWFPPHGLAGPLVGLARRAELIRDLGRFFHRRGLRWLDELHERVAGRVESGDSHLVGELAQCQAYRDPIRKKTYFLLSLMRNSGLWTFADPEHLGPPVDYHEVRGHLRLGTVEVLDPDLHQRLLTWSRVSSAEDLMIRRATAEAVVFLAERVCSGDVGRLHYLFWNLFRSCCPRDAPHCWDCPSTPHLPERYHVLTLTPTGERRCPWSPVCFSARREPKYLEHRFETDFY